MNARRLESQAIPTTRTGIPIDVPSYEEVELHLQRAREIRSEYILGSLIAGLHRLFGRGGKASAAQADAPVAPTPVVERRFDRAA